jgi:hypothetical protein
MKKINDVELMRMIEEQIPQTQIAEHFRVSPSAITHAKKKIQSAMNIPESFKALTGQEQAFCLARVEGKSQTAAAFDAYNCSSPASARSLGHELSKRDDVQMAICDLMEEEGCGRRYRIRRLKDHIDNTTDRQSSLKGIDIANKMESLYIERQVTEIIDYGQLFKEFADVQSRRMELQRELGLSADGIIDVSEDPSQADDDSEG